MSKIRIRITADNEKECDQMRKHFLKSHPQLIMSKPRKGSNPKYIENQKWFSYGDYQKGVIRRRRS